MGKSEANGMMDRLNGKPRAKRRWSWKDFWLATMVLPGAIWLLLIRYLPMLGVVIAFKDYKAQKPNTFWNNLIQSTVMTTSLSPTANLER